MTIPVNADVDPGTRDALSGLALGDIEVLGEALELREASQENSGLDARTFGLVKIAALVALDAPPASYLWQVSNALDAGASRRRSWGCCARSPRRSAARRSSRRPPKSWSRSGLPCPRATSRTHPRRQTCS